MVENPWQRLNIQPTSDKKSIKRAYSKLLKLTKPDKDPAGFQQLREAYETAIALSDFDQDATVNDIDETETSVSDFESVLNSDEDYEFSIQQGFDDEGQYFSSAQNTDPVIIDFLNNTKKMLLDIEARNKIDNWESLIQSELIMDLNYRHQISVSIFDEILKAQKAQYGNSRYFQLLNNEVVELLDNEFDWSNDEYLQSAYSDRDYFKIANPPKTKQDKEPDEKAFIGYRLLANIIDFGGLFFLVYGGFAVFNSGLNGTFESIVDSTEFHMVYWPIVVVYNVVFEFSRKRATIGKQLFKLYVDTEFIGLMPYLKLLVRNVVRFITIFIWIGAYISAITNTVHFGLIIWMIFGPLFAYSYFISAKVLRRNV